MTSLKGGVWRITGPAPRTSRPSPLHALDDHARSGCDVHLDASSLDRSRRTRFSVTLWDINGDGKIDGRGITFDVSYPTAGARPITLTVMDAVGAHSSRTLPVYVGGKTTPPGSTSAAGRLRATMSAPSPQKLGAVRKNGLLIRFRANASATWALAATLRRARRVHATRLHAAHGRLARKAFKAHVGSGTVRLRRSAGAHGRDEGACRARAGPGACRRKSVQRAVLVRVLRSLSPRRAGNGSDRPCRSEPSHLKPVLSTRSGCGSCDRATRRSRGCRSGRPRP